MKFNERLDELKAELMPLLQSRMIFLLNPKDTKTLESIVAWSVLPKVDRSNIEVRDDATMKDLWDIADVDAYGFSIALGCRMTEALPRLEQLKQLNLIYPDGSVAELAMTIVNVYIKNRVKEIQGKEKD